MASVPTTPAYGSAADLAAYSGLSVKTIRRLVDAQELAAFKVGRRLVIPFESIDRHIRSRRRPVMSPAAPAVSPRRSVDARGRVIPMTEAEVRARAEEAIRALDALDDMGDEDEQRATLDALIEGINAHPLSDRKRFR